MIDEQIIQHTIPENSTLIVGFSGGPDSVLLLTLLTKLAPKLNLIIIAAHLDHQWRAESAKDALWCKKFCDRLNSVECIIQTPTELNFNIKNNGSKEEVGRKLRRLFFEKLAVQFQASHIVLAHHADDQLENFFIRLARGTSVAGLTGMKPTDGLYLRPLLKINKQEILEYLKHHNIKYLTDNSNFDTKYLRNRIRHQLIPTLNQIDNRFSPNITKCMNHLQQTDEFLAQLAEQTLQTISYQNTIHTQSFLKLHEILQHRILMHLFIKQNISMTPSTTLFEELIRFLHAKKHLTHQIHPTCSLVKKADCFYFQDFDIKPE